jgi:hypothetical protein
MSMKKSSDTIGNRSRVLSVCSAVPQPLRHGVPQSCHSTTYFTVKLSCLASHLLPLMTLFSNCHPKFFACTSPIYALQNEAIPLKLHAVTDEASGIKLDLPIHISYLALDCVGAGQLHSCVVLLQREGLGNHRIREMLTLKLTRRRQCVFFFFF